MAVLGSPFQPPGFLPIQSLEIWPTPPHWVQTTLFVTLGLSWHCQALWSFPPQFEHRGPSPSRRVPFNSANSRSWCLKGKKTVKNQRNGDRLLHVEFRLMVLVLVVDVWKGKNYRYFGNGGSSKIRLLECYEVPWIHFIDTICNSHIWCWKS